MIQVTVHLISAVTGNTEELGRMYLANDGITSSENPAIGDYVVAVCRKGNTDVPKPLDPEGHQAIRSGAVRGYPRLAYNMWRLITRGLLSAFPEEDVKRGKNRDASFVSPEVLRGLLEMQDLYDSQVIPDDQSSDVRDAYSWLSAFSGEVPNE